MSTDWGVGCRDCQARYSRGDYYGESLAEKGRWFGGEFNNCRDVAWLQKVCDARDAVVALCDALGDAALSWIDSYDVGNYACRASDFADFFRAHAGHAVAPMDEYGRFHDQCQEYVPEKGHLYGDHMHCLLRLGHAPPCSNVTGNEDESHRRCDACGAQTEVHGFVAVCTDRRKCGHVQTLRRDPPRPEPAPRQQWLHRSGGAYDVLETLDFVGGHKRLPECVQWMVRPAEGGDAFTVGRRFFECSSLARERSGF